MKKVKLLILAALAVMISATSFAADADFPARPDTAIFVNDFAGVLRQSKVIDDSLRAFSKRTTNQIMVITVKDLGDYEPKMYAAELGDRWGIGQAKLDNGFDYPHQAQDQRLERSVRPLSRSWTGRCFTRCHLQANR